MIDATEYALIATAAGTSLLHTLIPDHWLPFVLIGKARRWNAATTAAVSGLSSVVHVLFSIALGLLALRIGETAAGYIGETLEQSGAALLVLFGVGYAWWAWHKGGHFHPGGSLLHSKEAGGICEGTEGDANPEHLHYHADDRLIRGQAGWSAVWLALIVGINPCVLILPVMLAAAGQGVGTVWRVSLAYGIPTLVLTVGMSTLGVAWSGRIRLPGAARYMEMASGLLIALLGVAFWLLEH